MPTDSRTVDEVIPLSASCSSESWLWVVVAGWMTSERTSPTLATWLNSLSALMNFAPLSRPPFSPKVNPLPAPLGRYLWGSGD